MARGFTHLVAVMDGHSRKIRSWRRSNPLGSDFCNQALEEALVLYGRPEISNEDSPSGYASKTWSAAIRLLTTGHRMRFTFEHSNSEATIALVIRCIET
jgi:transposase InsO family protein